MSNSEPSAIVLQGIPCMCDYTSFDSNGEDGSLKVRRDSGWVDVETLLNCNQQATNDALLTVMSEERKLRDRAVVQRNG
jgi:hypothetical protein